MAVEVGNSAGTMDVWGKLKVQPCTNVQTAQLMVGTAPLKVPGGKRSVCCSWMRDILSPGFEQEEWVCVRAGHVHYSPAVHIRHTFICLLGFLKGSQREPQTQKDKTEKHWPPSTLCEIRTRTMPFAESLGRGGGVQDSCKAANMRSV